MQPESDIDALKQEVEELKELTADTNRQVHKMKRGARWALLFQLVWWLSILGITGAAYYYYVQPYVQKIEQFYMDAQHGAGQAQGWYEQMQQFFAKYFAAPPPSESPSAGQ